MDPHAAETRMDVRARIPSRRRRSRAHQRREKMSWRLARVRRT
jgi:hypothetical protein